MDDFLDVNKKLSEMSITGVFYLIKLSKLGNVAILQEIKHGWQQGCNKHG